MITKNGVPRDKLVPAGLDVGTRSPAHALGLSYIAEDFDDHDPAIQALFAGEWEFQLIGII